VTALRKRRIWTIADFARHAYADDSEAACLRARRYLIRLNAKHGGALLRPSVGVNRGYTCLPAPLARLEADLLAPVESLEFRVDELEESLDVTREDQRAIVSQTRNNSREIAQLKRRQNRAA
jgi:hypothetical protein